MLMRQNAPKLTWAMVDFDNKREMAKLVGQDLERAGENIRAAVQDLRKSGIIDENGRRVRADTPPVMQESAKRRCPRDPTERRFPPRVSSISFGASSTINTSRGTDHEFKESAAPAPS